MKNKLFCISVILAAVIFAGCSFAELQGSFTGYWEYTFTNNSSSEVQFYLSSDADEVYTLKKNESITLDKYKDDSIVMVESDSTVRVEMSKSFSRPYGKCTFDDMENWYYTLTNNSEDDVTVHEAAGMMGETKDFTVDIAAGKSTVVKVYTENPVFYGIITETDKYMDLTKLSAVKLSL